MRTCLSSRGIHTFTTPPAIKPPGVPFALAMYAGPMKQMLEAYFPAGTPPIITFDAGHGKYLYAK